MKLSVLMPVYNEINTIEEIIRRVEEVDIPKEIIIVDDYSTDGSREYLAELEKKKGNRKDDIKILFHGKNKGKGAAISTALRHITGEAVVIQDADLEYDPLEYKRLLKPIIDGKADVVYGSRLIGGETHRVLFFWHSVGNKILTILSNMLTNINLTDMETGFKIFKAEVLKDINIKSDRFGFEPEITAKIAKKGWRIYETSISYYGRDYSQGKKINWKDGIAALFHIIRFRFFD